MPDIMIPQAPMKCGQPSTPWVDPVYQSIFRDEVVKLGKFLPKATFNNNTITYHDVGDRDMPYRIPRRQVMQLERAVTQFEELRDTRKLPDRNDRHVDDLKHEFLKEFRLPDPNRQLYKSDESQYPYRIHKNGQLQILWGHNAGPQITPKELVTRLTPLAFPPAWPMRIYVTILSVILLILAGAVGTLWYMLTDHTPPVVIGSPEVLYTEGIDLVFSEPIKKPTKDILDQVEFHKRTRNVKGVKLFEDGIILRMYVSPPFTEREEISLSFSGISDLAGNKMGDTKLGPVRYYDKTPPSVVKITEQSKRVFKVQADEALKLSLDASCEFTAGVDDRSGKPITAKITSTGNQDTFLLRLSRPLSNHQSYTLSFRGVTDQAKNQHPLEPWQYDYVDAIPPTVKNAAIYDTDGVHVRIEFDEPLSASSVLKENFSFNKKGLNVYRAELADDGKTVRLTTDFVRSFLTGPQSLRLTIGPGIADASGNNLKMSQESLVVTNAVPQKVKNRVKLVAQILDQDDKSVANPKTKLKFQLIPKEDTPSDFAPLVLKKVEISYGEKGERQLLRITINQGGRGISVDGEPALATGISDSVDLTSIVDATWNIQFPRFFASRRDEWYELLVQTVSHGNASRQYEGGIIVKPLRLRD